MSLEGKFRQLREESFADLETARRAIEAHAASAGYTHVKAVDDDEEPDELRFTARTPKGRAGRNIAFLTWHGEDPCVEWVYKGVRYSSSIESKCAACGAIAVIELPAAIKAEQKDGTTHVCHPLAGGCNHGFARAGAA